VLSEVAPGEDVVYVHAEDVVELAGEHRKVLAFEHRIKIDAAIIRGALEEGVGVVPRADGIGGDAELAGKGTIDPGLLKSKQLVGGRRQ